MSTHDEEPARTAPIFEPEPRPLGWTAGADLGLLVLRLVLGGTFVAHGAQKLFGAFDGPGIAGFAQYLDALGFRQTTLMAWVTGLTEFVGGVLVVLGLLTPLAAAGLLGVMISSVAVKWPNGFFTGTGQGFELDLVLAAAAACLLLAGPGRAAVDTGRVWMRRPLISGLPFLVLAVGAAVLVLLMVRDR
ncbi:DoxX family protein [Streptoalloteichus tenebrarius]|uniref:DoxX family protein n=1 Tax=Streptoalloteichus tenebrarius (strain ATCC 17920 / DSM 40477 / JCM 4838 / CBS 697.72 / NBRC 16177 / NCIMB 11028 / NRRL B-12390 / A12253. 1 / ISP 5477) TaxID=1933 RepID=UPI0020A5E79E|nr:DoxX family protein [Streptoalloteichus tenebrarius]